MTPTFRAVAGFVFATFACGGNVQTDDDGGADGAADSGVDALAPTSVVTGLSAAPSRMASDGSSLFWIDSQSGALSSVPVNGGQPTILASQASALALALDDTNVFFIQANTLVTMLKAGGAPTTVSDGHPISGAAVAHGLAFWTEVDIASPTHSLLEQAPSHGGVVSGSLLLAEILPPQKVAATASNVFLASPSLSYVNSTDIEESVAAVSNCNEIVSDDDAAYCVPPSGGSLTKIAEDGTASTLVATVYAPHGLSLDATTVYWADNPPTGPAILGVSKQGGVPVSIVSAQALAVAVDAAAVYWATSDGAIQRLSKQ